MLAALSFHTRFPTKKHRLYHLPCVQPTDDKWRRKSPAKCPVHAPGSECMILKYVPWQMTDDHIMCHKLWAHSWIVKAMNAKSLNAKGLLGWYLGNDFNTWAQGWEALPPGPGLPREGGSPPFSVLTVIFIHWPLYSFLRAVVPKYHKQSGLEQLKYIVSQFWRPVQNQGVGRC